MSLPQAHRPVTFHVWKLSQLGLTSKNNTLQTPPASGGHEVWIRNKPLLFELLRFWGF